MSANSEPVSTNPSSRVMPKGAWDCHTHVFGPTDRFPLAQSGAYAPPPSDRNLHLAVLDQLGLDHALLIQPSPYGEDHGALLDALSQAVDLLFFRSQLRTVMSWIGYPQMMVRVGQKPDSAAAPLTARRPVNDVVTIGPDHRAERRP